MNYFLLDKHHASKNTPQTPTYFYKIYVQDCAHGDDALAETKKLFVDFTSLVLIVIYWMIFHSTKQKFLY